MDLQFKIIITFFILNLKRKFRIQVFSLISISICLSCSSNHFNNHIGDNKLKLDTLVINIEDCDQIIWDSIVSDVKIIFLENTPTSLIGSISDRSLFDKRIYILDKVGNRLMVFDQLGKFIGHVGKRGKGFDEYLSIRDIAIDPSTQHVFILDYRFIFEFDSTLRFINKYQITADKKNKYINPLSFYRFSNEIYYFWVNGYEGIDKIASKNPKYHLHKMLDGKIEESSIEIQYMDNSLKRFISSKYVYIMPSEFDYVIKRLDNNGLGGGFFVDFRDKKIPFLVINKDYTFSANKSNKLNLANYCSSINMFIETDSLIYFQFIHKGVEYNFIRNIKTNQTLSGYNQLTLMDIIPLGNIIGYDKVTGSFVTYVEPIEILQLIRNKEIKSRNKISQEILNSFLSIKDTDNPILVFIKLKF